MVAFQDAWDEKCKEIFNIPILKPYAKKKNGEKLTYEDLFYRPMKPKQEREREPDGQCERISIARENSKSQLYGFPMQKGNWCTSDLKLSALRISNIKQEWRKLVYCTQNSSPQQAQGEAQKINIVHYIGIAADEPKRIKKHIRKKNIVLPLVQIGWDEALCGLEATYMGMLSPTYFGGCRDGCWFCHNQTVDQLRLLRKEHPDLWAILLKWDSDSPVTFRPPAKSGKRGLTVHDFDARFQLEDEGWVTADEPWKWSYLKNPPVKQLSLF